MAGRRELFSQSCGKNPQTLLSARSLDITGSCPSQAGRWARRQEALSRELRAATSLARLLRDRDRIGEARDLLASIYERFTEGFGTADLQAGKKLLDELSSPHRQ